MNPLTLKIAALVTVLIFSFEADTENQPQRTDKEREKGTSGGLLKVDKEKYSLIYWKNIISQFNSTYPQENVYMMVDNTSYYAGETIYFKAWLTLAGESVPSEISKVLYVDIVNPEGMVVLAGKYKIKGGETQGSIILPDSVSAAEYRIRAYTRWQENFSSDNLFERVVAVYNYAKYYGFNYSKKLCRGRTADTLKLKIGLTDIHKSALAGTPVTVKITTGGFSRNKARDMTDSRGMCEMKFVLPHEEKKRTVYVTVTYKDGWKTMVRNRAIALRGSEIKVKFYPEGGRCIEGADNIIAYKAEDENGDGIAVRGAIVDKENKEMLRFESEYGGMGKFRFRPEAGEKYKAIVWKEGEEGKNAEFNIPDIETEGYNMICTPARVPNNDKENNELLGNAIKIKLTKSYKKATGTEEYMGLLLQHAGKEESFKEVKFSGGKKKDSMYIYISIDQIKEGIHQLTLFSEEGEPLAERIFFVRHTGKGEINLTISKNKRHYGPRERVVANLYAKSRNGKPVEGKYSVSVRDVTEEPLRNKYENNLITSLLLTNDIKGRVENPGYYVEEGHEKEADLLMLTQGWRRYEWKKETMKELFPLKYKAEKGIVISGDVKSLTLKRPVADCKVTMSLYVDSVLYVGDTLTDRKGDFEFVCDFNGRRGLRLETSKKKKNGKNKKIDKLIMLKRDVAPVCRVSYLKSNPWPEEKKKESQPDSLAEKVTISNSGIKVRRTKEGYLKTLPEVKVTKKTFNEVIRNEAVAVYNVDRIREDLKDKGEYNFNTANLYEGLYEMLYSQDYKDWDRIESYNKYRNTRADTCENVAGELRYKGKKVIIVNASWTQNRIGENGNIANLAGGYTINDVKKILVIEDPGIIRQYLRVYDTELEHLFDYSAVVVFYLYPDGKNRREYVGIRNTYYEGYSLVKEFYSPDYSMDKDLPDLDHRRTLYWNPDVRTDTAGHALINFYNNDNSTDIEFTVEGFSDSGLPGDMIR